jgi:hypothetical protein
MKRRLVLEIDSNDDTCGACPHRRVKYPKGAGRAWETSECALFDVGLGRSTDGIYRRVTGCLAAESAARPWEGDDGTPMHLRPAEGT